MGITEQKGQVLCNEECVSEAMYIGFVCANPDDVEKLANAQ